jgi:hypothetical protein
VGKNVDDEIVRDTTTMLDTTPITTAITRLIAAGVAEGELVARVVRQFPDQVATTAAERRIIKRTLRTR